MTHSINGVPLRRTRIRMGRHGLWSGEVAPAGPLVLASGDAVELVTGDTTWRGTVVPGAGGTWIDEASYTITAGKGWSAVIPERGYSIPAGVRLSAVAAHLAAAAGEQLDVTGADRVLGDHWTRPAGPASLALSDLFPLSGGGYRVDPDGIARPGARPPAPIPAGLELALEAYEPARRWARVSLPGDQVSALLPGAVLTGPTLLAPLVVGESTITVSADSVSVELLGEGGALELFAALVQALTPSRIYNGLWTYQVADADTGRPNLQALATVAGLPAQLATDKVPGLAGVDMTLAPGALVLVAFRDGDPAKPILVGFLGGTLPLALSLTTQGTGPIMIGGDVPAASGPDVASALAVLAGAINTLGGSVPTSFNVSFTKLKGG